MKCILTGSNGYVGSRIREALTKNGHEVIEFKRKDTSTPFELGNAIPKEYFSGADALIHCAYDFTPRSWEDIQQKNVQGSIELFRAAKEAGVQTLLFISSISAYEGCRSLYGRAKLEVERYVISQGGKVVRPGLVYGESAGGMVGSLTKVVRNSKVIPVIGSEQEMFLSHEADLTGFILKMLTAKEIDRPILAANETPWKFGHILRRLASKEGTSPVFFPLPWQLVWLGLKTFETLGLKLGFRSDSLISLAYPNPKPDFNQPAELGTPFRAFS